MFPTARTPPVPVLRGSLYDGGYRVRLEWNDLAHPGIRGYEIPYGPSGSAAWRTIVANAGNLLQYGNDTIPRLPSSETRTAKSMFVFNAFRDEGPEHTDGREFRIRALNAAGNRAGPTGGALAVGEEPLRPSPLPESRQQERHCTWNGMMRPKALNRWGGEEAPASVAGGLRTRAHPDEDL